MAKAKTTEVLSREELVCILRALLYGQFTSQRGDLCTVKPEGVYCQFNRPDVEGCFHITVNVPETFELEVV